LTSNDLEAHVAVKPLLAGAIAGLVMLATACGSDDPDSSASTPAPAVAGSTAPPGSAGASTEGPTTASTGAASTPSAATVLGGDVPMRIVSLSPTHTETLFAIGAGPQVIAVDDQSNHPAEAAAVRTDLSGYQPNVEAIAGYEPDLVVTSGDDVLTEQLEGLGLTVWAGASATSFEDAYTQIEQLGAATGHTGEAAELVGQLQADLDALVTSLPTSETPLTVFHELSPDGYSASSATFIGQIYELFGLRNIADAAEEASGYPQLNAETIIAANPDLIFLADTKCCGESLETVAARDGWDQIRAVQDGHVFAMDDDVASRWGPRFVEYAEQVHDAVEQALVPAG
jgi:iron complex transport system substrate-binding protein